MKSIRYRIGKNLPRDAVFLDGAWRSKNPVNDPITYYLICYEDDKPTWDMTDLFGLFSTLESAQAEADLRNAQEEAREEAERNKVVSPDFGKKKEDE